MAIISHLSVHKKCQSHGKLEKKPSQSS